MERGPEGVGRIIPAASTLGAVTSQGPERHDGSVATARSVAALVMVLQALVLLGYFGFFVYEIMQGASDGTVLAGTLSGLILVFAILSSVLGRGWMRGARWPRTPTILWNALLLPVAWSLHDAGRSALGLGLGVLALVGILSAVLAGPGGTHHGADEVS
jgi:hypothetical protein